MKRILLIPFLTLIVVCFSFKNKGVATWEVTNKAEVMKAYESSMSWFTKNTNYRVNIKYESFSDQSSGKPYDHSDGFYKRMNQNFHSSSLGITTVQNEKLCIVIDSTSQIVVLKNKTGIKESPFDLKQFEELLDNIKGLKKQVKENGEIVYRIEFKSNELLEASEFQVDRKGLIIKMKYFYSREMIENEDDVNSKKGKPRLEISFGGYQTNINFNYEMEFSEKLFLKEDKGKFLLNNYYKNYVLKDYRIKGGE